MPEAAAVRSMFARIAPRYDLLNHLLSAGVDRRWRARAVAAAGERGRGIVVDVATGTGDLGLAFARAGARVVGVDFTRAMLARAVEKAGRRGARGGRTLFVGGDALRLPVRSAAADVACIAFGIRNVADRRAGLAEMVRVVRPGGCVLVLEFSLPPSRFLAALYRLYFTRLLPRIGGWISGDAAAYRYLPATVLGWPSPAELGMELGSAGLVDCGFRRLTGGIACLSWGRVPATGDP
ncbi:MAG: ubiquinone/menaquinone biosynthesis methyltransferase [Planctomycetota bacterium]